MRLTFLRQACQSVPACPRWRSMIANESLGEGRPGAQGQLRAASKFIVGQRVVKQGEDSRFEGEVVACFVKRNHKTVRYVVENDDGVLHIAGEAQLRLAMPKRAEG